MSEEVRKDEEQREAKKTDNASAMYSFEQKIRGLVVPRIPCFIETYHLTFMTFLWSGMIILFGFLANKNSLWLFAFSFVIALQWFTDILDGGVGRYRNTGLIKWGFYADHFTDYVFMCSIALGYHFFFLDFPGYNYLYLFLMGFISIGFMASSFLYFGVLRRMVISVRGFGPSELRLLLVLLNFLIILLGKGIFVFLLPYATLFLFVVLAVVFYFVQKELWAVDMKIKHQK